MTVTRKIAAEKIAAYLRHEITLGALVDWAERVMMEGELAAQESEPLRQVISRLGVADVRAFGLSWEECEGMLRQLGYQARVEVAAI